MKRQILYFLLFFILFAACNKKEYPKDVIENNDATFFIKLHVNGSPIELEGGKNGYYMYSTYQQNANGLYSFIGELKPDGTRIGNSTGIKIEFRDSKISNINGSSNIHTSLVTGNYQFFDATYTSSYGVEFESGYNQTPKTYLWDFGDGTKSAEKNPVHYFKDNKTYSTCLSIEGTTSCMSSICMPVSIGSNAFNGYINSQYLLDSTFLFSVINLGGKAPFNYWWTFGDGGTSQLANPKHAYNIGGSYPVNVRISDADSKTLNLSYNIVTFGDPSSCSANIKVKSILPMSLNLGLSQVAISYTDANGEVYTSSAIEQNNNSAFNVLSVEDFENNENGEKTKKIKLNFKCDLVSGNKTVQVESNDCIICVAYK